MNVLDLSIPEICDISDEQADKLTPAQMHFVAQVIEAVNAYQLATMPEPVTVSQIAREVMKVFTPHQLH